MKKYDPQKIVEYLRLVETAAANGQRISDCVQQIGVTEVTYYRWRNRFGGLNPEQAQRKAELENEIIRLRRTVSDLTLDTTILVEAISEALTPAHRSEFVLRVMTALGISERRACRALRQHRSTQRKIKARKTAAMAERTPERAPAGQSGARQSRIVPPVGLRR
jgi:putative transposase